MSETRSFRIVGGRSAPADARHSFSVEVRGWLGDGPADTARLLLSELVTTAVRHGSGDDAGAAIGVSLCRDSSGGIRVRVAQPGVAVAVRAAQRSPERVDRFGLRLVESLAKDWGVVDDPPSVWFEVAA